MSVLKTLLPSAVALLLLAGQATAVTVKNTSEKEISIGVDYGAKEEVKNVAAGKSATFECDEGCGVTGPWGYSWMAEGDATFSTDGSRMVAGEALATEGAGEGTEGSAAPSAAPAEDQGRMPMRRQQPIVPDPEKE
jgi:hypothetical protein